MRCARSSSSASEYVDHRAREKGRVVGRCERLVRIAESRKVTGDHPKRRRQRRDRWQERALRRPESVQKQHRVASARGHQRDTTAAGVDVLEPKPGGAGVSTGRGEEAEAQVQVVAHVQPALVEGVHTAAQIGGNQRPRRSVGRERRVGRESRIGRLHLRHLAPDNEVPGVSVDDLQTDAREGPRHVHRRTIEPFDQRSEKARQRRGAARRRHFRRSLRTRSCSVFGEPQRRASVHRDAS